EKLIEKRYKVNKFNGDGKIVDYIQGELNIRRYGKFKNLFLENIYVLKKYRRKGVARLLVQMFTEYWCKKRKYVELVTTKKNRKIFEKLGFEWTMVYMKIDPELNKLKK
ncbi:MAG: GNAT family N-acetyltransferase, partial [Candidatus Micrarchaeia archaeon]